MFKIDTKILNYYRKMEIPVNVKGNQVDYEIKLKTILDQSIKDAQNKYQSDLLTYTKTLSQLTSLFISFCNSNKKFTYEIRDSQWPTTSFLIPQREAANKFKRDVEARGYNCTITEEKEKSPWDDEEITVLKIVAN
jgi:hypothetical protein